MENIVALLGVFLFWLALFFLPLTLYRAFHTSGKQQIWTIAALMSFGLVFLGFTRAVAGGSVMEAFAWSVSWLMPVGLMIFARSPADTPLRKWDVILGVVAALSFFPAVPFIPLIMQSAAAALW